MQKKESAIEVKVGALVIFGLALLVAFIVILGDFSWHKGYVVYVDYDNAAGLKPGADVAISGIKAGRVEQIDFLGGKWDEETKRRVFVRCKLTLEEEMAYAVREDSEFYITTQGVLGEKYIEILTTNLESKKVTENAKRRGVDPPRMELLLARASKLLNDLAELLGRDDVPLGDLVRNANNLAKHADELIVENRPTLRAIFGNIETVTRDATDLTAALKTGLDDGSDIRASLQNVRSLTRKLDRDIDPLTRKTLSTLDRTESLAASLDSIVTGAQVLAQLIVEWCG